MKQASQARFYHAPAKRWLVTIKSSADLANRQTFNLALHKYSDDTFAIRFGAERTIAPIKMAVPKSSALISFYELMNQAIRLKDRRSVDQKYERHLLLKEIRRLTAPEAGSERISPNTIPYAANNPIPLGYAGKMGDTELMDVLYENGASINLRNTDHTSGNKDGQSVLMHTIEGGDLKAIDWVLAKPELKFCEKPKGKELLYVSNGPNARAIFERLTQHGFDLNQPISDKQQTALHWYVSQKNGNFYTTQALLTLGADPAIQDKFGNTTLHAVIAAYISHRKDGNTENTIEVLKLLLQYDNPAHPLRTTRNKAGQTPADLLQTAMQSNNVFKKFAACFRGETHQILNLIQPG